MKPFIAPVLSTLLIAAASAYATTSADLYGAPPEQPVANQRTIVIDENTKYVNVARGDIADLVINGRDYPWEFNGTSKSFPLNNVVPPDTLDHTVMVYVGSHKGVKP